MPRPLNRDQDFWAAIVARLDRQNQLLTQVRDRLPAPAEPATGPGAVELTEPAVPGSGATVSDPADLAKQPASSPAKKTPAKKPAGAKRGARTAPSKTSGGTAKRPAGSKPAEGNT